MASTVSDLGFKIIVLSFVLALLPASPFVGFNALVAELPYLNWLNWFIPISQILVIFESWLAVVAVYYGILYLLNYVGVIKS